ncbi:MAG: S24 family peptidase [Flavobacteriales bacterium]|nr:S24 family peptidase [Flavobacteriales bacterium]
MALPGERFRGGGLLAIQVTGDSMEPTILDGDWLVVRKCDHPKGAGEAGAGICGGNGGRSQRQTSACGLRGRTDPVRKRQSGRGSLYHQ